MPPSPVPLARQSHRLSSSSDNQVSASQRNKTSHSPNEIIEETYNIVKYVIYFSLGEPVNSSPSPQAIRFRELVEDILKQNDVFNCICVNLQITPSNVQNVYRKVVQSMFQDNIINWGRLVSQVAFSVKVAEHLRAFGNYDAIVVELSSDTLLQEAGRWVSEKGGWENIVAHFQKKQSEESQFSLGNDSWIKGMLVTATATLGLGALFAVTCK